MREVNLHESDHFLKVGPLLCNVLQFYTLQCFGVLFSFKYRKLVDQFVSYTVPVKIWHGFRVFNKNSKWRPLPCWVLLELETLMCTKYGSGGYHPLNEEHINVTPKNIVAANVQIENLQKKTLKRVFLQRKNLKHPKSVVESKNIQKTFSQKTMHVLNVQNNYRSLSPKDIFLHRNT